MSFLNNVVSLIIKSPFTQKIGFLTVDILNEVVVREKATLTINPVEGGFNTDNARDEPTEISFTGKISAFSLKNSVVSQIASLAQGTIPNRMKEAHDELYRIKNEKQPITLMLKYKEYNDMYLTMLEIPRRAGDGEALIFTAVFQQLIIAESQLVSISNSKISSDTAKKQSNYGRQVPADKAAAPALKPSQITLGQFIKTLF